MITPSRLLTTAQRWRKARLIAKSGLFDSSWYLRRYPDIAAAGVDPLRHYVESGFAEGRFPNQVFDSRWYARTYLGTRDENPLVDYIRSGAAKGRQPNRWFDPAFYKQRHGVSERDALRHYLTVGGLAGFQTSVDAPVPDYAPRYPDIGKHGTPLGSFLHDYRIIGGIDRCTSYYVAGWTWRRQGPEMSVTILVNGVSKGSVTPWSARPDVKKVKGIDGQGFFFRFPTRLSDGDLVELVDEFGDRLNNCATTYTIPPLGTSKEHYPSRAAIAAAFLKGRGLEIGAFTQPTDLPPDREIVFFDRFTTDDLRRFYDPDCGRPLMEPTYVGEAETLDGVPDAAFDFVIANHVIEHLLDPIGFLKRIAVTLKEDGRAMIAAPDKRYSFDLEREITPFDHLVSDHEKGGATSQFDHFLERAHVEGKEGEAAISFARRIDPGTIHFHYHVWDAPAFVAFIEAATETYGLPFKLLHMNSTTHDIIVVVEKTRPFANG